MKTSFFIILFQAVQILIFIEKWTIVLHPLYMMVVSFIYVEMKYLSCWLKCESRSNHRTGNCLSFLDKALPYISILDKFYALCLFWIKLITINRNQEAPS